MKKSVHKTELVLQHQKEGTVSTHVVAVAKLNTSQNLPKNLSYSHFTEPVWVFLQIIKHSMINKFKHEIKALLTSENLNEIYKILMSQFLEKTKERYYFIKVCSSTLLYVRTYRIYNFTIKMIINF